MIYISSVKSSARRRCTSTEVQGQDQNFLIQIQEVFRKVVFNQILKDMNNFEKQKKSEYSWGKEKKKEKGTFLCGGGLLCYAMN